MMKETGRQREKDPMSHGSGVPEKLGLRMGQRGLPPPGGQDLTAWWGWMDSWFSSDGTKLCLVLAPCKPSFLCACCPQQGKEASGKQRLKFVNSSATSPLLCSDPSNLQTPHSQQTSPHPPRSAGHVSHGGPCRGKDRGAELRGLPRGCLEAKPRQG